MMDIHIHIATNATNQKNLLHYIDHLGIVVNKMNCRIIYVYICKMMNRHFKYADQLIKISLSVIQLNKLK